MNFENNKTAKIYVAGHRGLAGSAIMRKLEADGYSNIICATSSELDLRDNSAVGSFFKNHQPDYVFLAAAKVGGIMANKTYPATFLYDNLCIQNNVIHQAYLNGVKQLLFLGSSCIYPKETPQPIKEEYLLTGSLEPTNDAYAVAKIAGIKMCQAYHTQYGCNFISVMPTNLYGPGDNYDLQQSHVFAALIRKFHEAKMNEAPSVTIWGSGTPRREFLHADDLADACIFLMQHYDLPEIINVGTGKDITIRELAGMIKDVSGYQGALEFDTGKPDGTMLKRLDVSKIYSLGWSASISLDEGIERTFREFPQEVI
jgi:GDP-L-fucose synthase